MSIHVWADRTNIRKPSGNFIMMKTQIKLRLYVYVHVIDRKGNKVQNFFCCFCIRLKCGASGSIRQHFTSILVIDLTMWQDLLIKVRLRK